MKIMRSSVNRMLVLLILVPFFIAAIPGTGITGDRAPAYLAEVKDSGFQNGYTSPPHEPDTLAMVPVTVTLDHINLPIYAHLLGRTGSEYVLVKANISDLNTSGFSYTILDPHTTNATYAIASRFTNQTREEIGRLVAVLLDDGKNLILKADPGQIYQLNSAGLEFKWLPSVPMTIRKPGETIPKQAAPIQYDARIAAMISLLNSDMLYYTVGALSGEFPVRIGGANYTILTRNTESGTPITKATSYAYEFLSRLNLSVSYNNWNFFGYTCRNVVGEKIGTVQPDEIILITAHLDSITYSGNEPGADDNGSGSAALLRIAEILDQYRFERTVRFVLFTGEEQGLLGSLIYADAAAEKGENIVAVFNMDMIGYNKLGGPVLEIHTRPQSNPSGYANDMVVAGKFTQSVSLYGLGSTLTPVIIPDGIPYSDHDSFWSYGYPAVLAIEDENDFNPYYHESSDRRQYLDMNYYTNFAKASLASLAHLASLSSCSSPVINRMNPSSGPNTSDLLVGINGTCFQDGLQVNLTKSGETNITATEVSVHSDLLINCTIPISGKAVGRWNLVVTNPDGKTGSLNDAFMIYDPTPAIFSLTPAAGQNNAVVLVTVTGNNLSTTATVSLTNSSLSIPGTITFQNGTTVRASFPLAGAPPWIYNLTIRKSDGLIIKKEHFFTVTNVTPEISFVTPATGYNSGNISVTITGSSFRNGASVSLINGSRMLSATNTNRTNSRILATFPLNGTLAGLYNLTVLNIDGTSVTKSNAFTVKPAGSSPIIDNFTPESGLSTSFSLIFTINGRNFSSRASVTITNGSSVKTVAASSATGSQIRCSFPLTGLSFGLYNLTVTNSDGTFGTRNNVFMVLNPPPTISGITPTTASNISLVNISVSGKNFLTDCTATLTNGSTTLNGSLSMLNPTKIMCRFDLPGNHAGLYTLKITNPGGPNATKPFLITSPGSDPVISDIYPDSGVNTGPLLVTINGTNFRSGASVTITNGTTIKSVPGKVTGVGKITCTLPLTGIPFGIYNLTVRNTDGSNGTLPYNFLVMNPSPTITGITPRSGFTSSTVQVKISGAKFVSGVQVSLVNGSIRLNGTVSGLTISVLTGTFNLTDLPADTYNLTVTNPGGPAPRSRSLSTLRELIQR